MSAEGSIDFAVAVNTQKGNFVFDFDVAGIAVVVEFAAIVAADKNFADLSFAGGRFAD